jgi:hypothetical protein
MGKQSLVYALLCFVFFMTTAGGGRKILPGQWDLSQLRPREGTSAMKEHVLLAQGDTMGISWRSAKTHASSRLVR